MAEWFSVDDEAAQQRVLAAWKDAPLVNLEVVGMLLDIAKEQVLEYAPSLSSIDQVAYLLERLGATPTTIAAVLNILDGTLTSETLATAPDLVTGVASLMDPPTRYVWAQLQQTKHLWNAGRVAPGGDVGSGDFVFAPRPLDRDIQRIIRPTQGVANVF